MEPSGKDRKSSFFSVVVATAPIPRGSLRPQPLYTARDLRWDKKEGGQPLVSVFHVSFLYKVLQQIEGGQAASEHREGRPRLDTVGPVVTGFGYCVPPTPAINNT